MALLTIMLFVSCTSSKPDSALASGNVRVLAPVVNRTAVKAGTYSLQVVELLGLSTLQEVSGQFVKFFFSPRINGKHLEGETPKGHFIKSTDGSFVPADELSQSMVAIYLNLQNLAKLDAELGIADLNKWPREVGVGVTIKQGPVSNNAYYDPAADAIFVLPFTGQSLPIAVNGGILAHEHFHSIFSKSVLAESAKSGLIQSLTSNSIHDRQKFFAMAGVADAQSGMSNTSIDIATDPDLSIAYHSALLRGMDEGLADFWGWMYSGDPDFIAMSLPSEKWSRSLNSSYQVGDLKLPNVDYIKMRVQSIISDKPITQTKDYLVGYAYNIGTQFSRIMKKFTNISALERGLQDDVSRKLVAGWLVKTLPKVRQGLVAVPKNSFYNPSQFLFSFADTVVDMQEQECQYLSEVVRASFSSEVQISCLQTKVAWKLVPKNN